jgi:FkbM family methyltransferase
MEKIIIEVGANNGDDTKIYAEQGFVYTFEPVPVMFENLKKEFSNKENVKIFNIAVSDYNGKAKFGISNPIGYNMGCSSLNEFSDDIENKWSGRSDFNMTEYFDTNVMRMDTFIENENLSHIDYLHCDAQGSDLKVLQSFGDKISILKEGRCEAANTVALYKGVDNNVYSIIDFLKENGFEITKLNNHHHQEISFEDLPNSTQEVDVHFKRI